MRADVSFSTWLHSTPLMARRKSVRRTLDVIENVRLQQHRYIAGDALTIADLVCYEELVQIDVWNLLGTGTKLGFDGDGSAFVQKHYPRIFQWLLTMRKLPQHDAVHAVMVKPGILNYVQTRQTAFAQFQSKL